MKALILSVSAGGGHKNAAEALEQYFRMKDPDSEVVTIDTIRYISPFLDRLIVGTYLNSLKLYPNAFKLLFQGTDNITPDDTFYNFVGKLNEFVADKLLPLIDEFHPDIMIGTHPFTAFMLQILRKKYNIDIPNIVIITDYGSHSFWVHNDIDYYVVAHEGMIPELTVRGREWETVLPLGIPVKPAFLGTFDRAQTLKKIGLDPDKKTVTLMGGALAIGNITDILKEIERIPMDFQIVVVTANNTRLYDEATEISLTSGKDISVLKYCGFMNALMQATDLLITKPGGLTVTEALISGCPMAIFFAIPGQEIQNAQFLLKNGIAFDIGDGKHCAKKVESILKDEEKLKEISRKSREFAKPYSTMHIYDRIAKSVEEYKNGTYKPAKSTMPKKWSDESSYDIFTSEDRKALLNRIKNLVSKKYKGPEDEVYYELTGDDLKEIYQSGNPDNDRNSLNEENPGQESRKTEKESKKAIAEGKVHDKNRNKSHRKIKIKKHAGEKTE